MTNLIPLAVLLGLLAACSQPPQPPLATTVCKLSTKPGRTVQIDATVSVDAEGNAMIGDSHCHAIRVALQLSTAAARAGADELLQAAAKQAVSSGRSSFVVTLAGVYTDTPQGTQFVASSVSIAAPH
ncbi:MAG: hypothetical protein WCD08_05215 [Steroidobacteraceae bacterium]